MIVFATHYFKRGAQCMLGVWLLWAWSLSAYAQEIPRSLFEPQNRLVSNPAYAATFQHMQVYSHGMSFMNGLEGSPEQLGLGITFPFSLPAGKSPYPQAASLRVHADKQGVFNTLYADAGYAQHFRLTPHQDLFLGVSAGVIAQSLVQGRIATYTTRAPGFFDLGDPALTGDTYKHTRLLASAGFTYRFRELEVNMALPSLFHYKGLEQNFMASVAYNWSFARGESEQYIQIIPMAVYRYQRLLPDRYAGYLQGIYEEMAWLSVGYESTQQLVMAAGVQLDKLLPAKGMVQAYSLGYAYGLGMQPLSHFAKSQHEIMLTVSLDREALPKWKWSRKQNPDESALSQLEEENQRLREENRRLTELINERQLSQDIQDEYTAKNDAVYNDYFVIVAAFYNEKDAKDYKQLLDAKTDIETQIIARKDRKYFFIYTNKFDTQTEAVEEINKLNKTDIVNYIKGNIWIYGED